MKKTFKFLAFAVVASLLSFTSCKDDPDGTEGGGQEQTSGVTFNFDGAVDWIPQSMHMGYEADEDEIFFMAVGTKEATTRQQAAEIIDNLDIDGDGIPTNALILGFYGYEGVQAMEGSILEEDGDLAVMLFTGTETIEGEVYPNGWASTNMTVTITELDMVNKKISATITMISKKEFGEFWKCYFTTSELSYFSSPFDWVHFTLILFWCCSAVTKTDCALSYLTLGIVQSRVSPTCFK